MNSPIRLFVVDDHPVVLSGLRQISELAPEFQIVGEAVSAASAWEAIRLDPPDAVLLDIRLPGEDGIQLCRRLKQAYPTLRVLHLTSFADDQLALAAMEAGSDGYVLKDSDTQKIIQSLRAIMSGKAAFAPVARIGRANARWIHALPDNPLTAQEKRVLAEVARGKTDKEVAQALLLSPKTVRNYLDRAFEKLKVNTRTEAAMVYTRLVFREAWDRKNLDDVPPGRSSSENDDSEV